jgi:hypothetical protein
MTPMARSPLPAMSTASASFGTAVATQPCTSAGGTS